MSQIARELGFSESAVYHLCKQWDTKGEQALACSEHQTAKKGPIIHSSGHSRARDRTRFTSIARPLDGVFQIAEKVPVQASYYTLFAGTMTWRIAPSGNLTIPEL